MKRVYLTLAWVCSYWLSAGLATAQDRKPFTVIDSITWTNIVNFAGDYSANPVAGTALFSPDGSRFVIHTRRGDLTQNVSLEMLLLFHTKAVEDYLSASSVTAPPQAKVLVKLKVENDSGVMSGVQWLNGEEIGFIAEGDNGQNQAFVANAMSGIVSQLTHSKTPVESFAAAGDVLLFYANVTAPPRPITSIVGDKTIGDVLFPPDSGDTPIELFEGSRKNGWVQRIQLPKMVLASDAQRIWISPTGAYAVILVPCTDAPSYWAEYKIPDYDLFGFTADRVSSDPTSLALILRRRYAVVDLEKHTVTPLFDAPDALFVQNGTPQEVFWTNDGNSVIVTHTYLPLNVSDREICKQRAEHPAIAAVNLKSRDVSTLFWEPVLSSADRAAGRRVPFAIVGIEWDEKQDALIVTTKRREPPQVGERFVFETHILQLDKGKWQETHADKSRANMNLSVELRQSLNERPKIYVVRPEGTRKVLFDPNPGADRLRFGWTEIVKWQDTKNDIEWKGGLIYPPGYEKGKQYPLIVQTHGFAPDEFVVDGPGGMTTGMAAQAFANAGFLVLQVEDNARAFTMNEREGPLFAEGFHSGIERLVSQGMVDPRKVGIIAFSRTGIHTLYLMALHPDLLAAVTFADASHTGYFGQLLLTNVPADLAIAEKKRQGGTLDLDQIADWFTTDPLYKLPKTKAAIRLEAISPFRIIDYWEIYSVLRQSGRPVDLVYYPSGSHLLMKPIERLVSQGGNVDWFRFWLQGYEDPDPTKAEQYVRWRKLRELHASDLKVMQDEEIMTPPAKP